MTLNEHPAKRRHILDTTTTIQDKLNSSNNMMMSTIRNGTNSITPLCRRSTVSQNHTVNVISSTYSTYGTNISQQCYSTELPPQSTSVYSQQEMYTTKSRLSNNLRSAKTITIRNVVDCFVL